MRSAQNLTLAMVLLGAPGVHAWGATVAEIDYAISEVSIAADAPSGQATLAAADLNGDGHADLVAASLDCACVDAYLGDGAGNLTPAARADAGPEPASIDIADLDDDGTLDLLIANHETDQLTILSGDGRGGFGAPRRIRIDVDPHPHVALARDVDADGTLDLLVDHRSEGGLAIVHGGEGGRFDSSQRLIDVGGDPYRGFVAQDLTNDGLVDLVTPNSDHVAIVINEGEGRFSPPRRIPASGPFSVAAARLRRADRHDIIAATVGRSSQLLLFDIPADGEKPVATAPLAPGAKELAVGDLDGDGRDEVVATSWSGSAAIFDWNGELLRRDLDVGGISNPWGIALADFDGDGRADIVLADGSSSRISLFLSGP